MAEAAMPHPLDTDAGPSGPGPAAASSHVDAGALPQGAARQLARAHLWLGVAALIGSGLLAIVLVLSRTPGIASVFPLRDLFRAALVVHVDLSVLIWFMAFAATLWTQWTRERAVALGWAGWALAAAGTLALTLSPFVPDAQPLLNNYIPVLDQPLFLTGLALCGAGFGLTMLRALVCGFDTRSAQRWSALLGTGLWASLAAGVLAWLTWAWTAWQLPAGQGAAHYELLFWGAGHVLQFQHALLALLAWLWLLTQLGAPLRVGPNLLGPGMALAALPLLVLPWLLIQAPVGSGDQMAGFAELMRWGHLAMLPLMGVVLAALPWLWRQSASPARSALLASLLLFVTGGVLAFLIRGVNVVVPAHYHGSIVGVTLAFMGWVYWMLPRLGFRTPDPRLARWQPLVYGGGQLMHILGLAWSGGYGVQRKVAGSEQVLLGLPERIGMGMMGLGGLIAIVGGLMFVLVCLKAMGPRRHSGHRDH